jgi:NADPH:quinone reductase-like Zn-dependent oxidoreductase
MKAIQITEFGDPEVMKYQDVTTLFPVKARQWLRSRLQA